MLDKLRKKLAAATETVTDYIKLSEGQRNERFDICKSCDQFHPTEFCKLCGCYMPLKTYIPSVSCPQKKWLPIQVSRQEISNS